MSSHLKQLLAAALVSGLLAGLPAAAQNLVPVGPHFQVNQETEGPQVYSAVATSPNGRFAVGWQRAYPFANRGSVRLYGADGNPASNEILLPMDRGVRAAVRDSGHAVAVGIDDDLGGIYGQRLLPDGAADGAAFRIAPASSTGGTPPAAVFGSDGSLLVVWQDARLRARRYDALGQPAAVFNVTGYTLPAGASFEPRLAALPSGGWLLAWPTVAGSVHFRLLTDAGAFDGAEIPLADVSNDFDLAGADAAGNFLLAHRGAAAGFWPPQSERQIWLSRFDRNGALLGRVQVSGSEADRLIQGLSLATGAAGRILLAGELDSTSATSYDVAVRLFDAAGTPLSGWQPLSDDRGGQQSAPSVAATPAGFVATWHSRDGSNLGVQARQLAATP